MHHLRIECLMALHLCSSYQSIKYMRIDCFVVPCVRMWCFMFPRYLDIDKCSNLVLHGLMHAEYLPKYRKTAHVLLEKIE